MRRECVRNARHGTAPRIETIHDNEGEKRDEQAEV